LVNGFTKNVKKLCDTLGTRLSSRVDVDPKVYTSGLHVKLVTGFEGMIQDKTLSNLMFKTVVYFGYALSLSSVALSGIKILVLS